MDQRYAPGGAFTSVSEESAQPGLTAAELSDLLANPGGGESKVQQAFKDEVDVNVIVRRFGVTQASAGQTMGVYGDFTGIHDYESAVERIEGAQRRFMSLPAEVRERFRNDPGVLIRAANELSEEEFARVLDPPKAVVATPAAVASTES